MSIVYVPCIKNGMNDIKALLNLKEESSGYVMPLVLTAGTPYGGNGVDLKKDYLLDEFIHNWDKPFIVDASRADSDSESLYNSYHNLTSQHDNFSGKITYYSSIYSINKKLIPAISWQLNDDMRNIVQLSLYLEQQYEKIAIIIDPNNSENLNRLDTLLCLFKDNSIIIVLLNYNSIYNKELPQEHKVLPVISKLTSRGVGSIVLLSSSFPPVKPAIKDTWIQSENTDLLWQLTMMNKSPRDSVILYGDYSATSPNSATEYIQGMQIIPSVTYFRGGIWYQIKSGVDKEFSKYKDIANELIRLDFFHGSTFCWGAENIYDIATNRDRKGGTPGTWNGYKINVHVEETIRILKDYYSTPLENYDEDSE